MCPDGDYIMSALVTRLVFPIMRYNIATHSECSAAAQKPIKSPIELLKPPVTRATSQPKQANQTTPRLSLPMDSNNSSTAQTQSSSSYLVSTTHNFKH